MFKKKSLYAKEAFTKESLPTNRRELFWDVFKNHFFIFIRIGVILLAFLLPIILLGVIKDYSYIQSADSGDSNFLTLVICNIVEIPFVVLLAFFVSGVSKIYREFSWLEPVFFKTDFVSGVKENLKPTLVSCLIIALMNFIFNFTHMYLTNGFIIAIPFGFCLFFFYPVLMHTIFIDSLYTNPYFKNFKLGCYFYFKHIPSTILLIILINLYKVLDWFQFANIVTVFIKYMIIVVIVVFFIPFILLAAQINENRIFDKHINMEKFPQLVNKGLYVPEALKNVSEKKIK